VGPGQLDCLPLVNQQCHTVEDSLNAALAEIAELQS
jgi:hypothetical protein